MLGVILIIIIILRVGKITKANIQYYISNFIQFGFR